jgi:Putative restriction endonuclease
MLRFDDRGCRRRREGDGTSNLSDEASTQGCKIAKAPCLAPAEVPFLQPSGLVKFAHDEALMNVQPDLHMDKAAFLAWVEGREGRYELAGGRVLMMTGGTMAHGLIVGNLFELLRARLDRKRWVVLTEFGVDVGPRTIRYADIVVDRPGASLKDLTAKAPALVA